jgi:muramoyltetrapeptide carboxypeptidase
MTIILTLPCQAAGNKTLGAAEALDKMTHPGEVLLPPRMHHGGTIGVVAPASPFERRALDQGVAELERLGFRTFVPDEIGQAERYLAGPDALRADVLNRMFADPKIDGIVCARGGYGSLRILSLLDYASIRQHPKPLVGFSDVTALFSALYRRCRLVTFHGPLATTLAGSNELSRRALLTALVSESALEISAPGGIVVRPGRARGPVIGGNLSVLCHLLATPFETGFDGHILFLEDRGEAAYRIDRMLIQLKLAGRLEGLAGLVLGSFRDCGSFEEVIRIFEDILAAADIPILAGFDAGHCEPNITLPLGLEATLDADRRKLIYHRPATL